MPQTDWQQNLYHPRHPLGALLHSHNRDALVSALNAAEIDLTGLRVLDLGCGYGFWLRTFVELGSNPTDLFGIDISDLRIKAARRTNPAINWRRIETDDLPLESESFDIVIQAVVFSSVLDKSLQQKLASEMARVNRRPGYILWIDHFRRTNDSLTAFKQKEVHALFPGYRTVYRDKIHPRYFRRFYQRGAAITRFASAISRVDCESLFLVLKRD